MIEKVHSISDDRLDVYASLTDLQLRSRLEPERGVFIAESSKVIDRALDAGYEPLSLLVPEHKVDSLSPLVDRMQSFGCPVYSAPSTEIEKLAGFELTRGVLAAMRRKPLPSVEDALSEAKRIAVLEDLTNHTNVGLIFRNAAAFGLDAVLVTPGCSDPLYRRAVRVSMGNVFNVPWTRIGSSVADWPEPGVNRLKSAGFVTAALALSDDALRLDDARLKEHDRLALIFGSEGPGLRDRTLSLCDFLVTIPMQNGVDSLNVAATSAVAFWELRERM